VGALGLAILPYKKSQAKADLRDKTDALRERMRASLSEEFTEQLGRSVERLREAIGPYSRFIRGEHERLLSLQTELGEVRQSLSELRHQVDQALPERVAGD
jgi:uncharacterized membrane protein